LYFLLVDRVGNEEGFEDDAKSTKDSWDFSLGAGCVIRLFDERYEGDVYISHIYLSQIVPIDLAAREEPRHQAALLVMRNYLNQYEVTFYKHIA
jgi:hypothetical protein